MIQNKIQIKQKSKSLKFLIKINFSEKKKKKTIFALKTVKSMTTIDNTPVQKKSEYLKRIPKPDKKNDSKDQL